jgi:hypothetical protein
MIMVDKGGTMDGKKRPYARYRVSAEEFVYVYNSSASRKEASERLGMPEDVVSSYASRLRREGVPLKKLEKAPNPRSIRLRLRELRKIAKEAMQGGVETDNTLPFVEVPEDVRSKRKAR